MEALGKKLGQRLTGRTYQNISADFELEAILLNPPSRAMAFFRLLSMDDQRAMQAAGHIELSQLGNGAYDLAMIQERI